MTTTDRIEKEIDLNAPVARVWRALTDHREFGAWFRVQLDGPFVEGKPSTGHMTQPGYEHVRWIATVRRIEPERLFSFSWHPYAIDQTVDYSGEPTTLVEFHLTPTVTGTRLVITESGFDAIPAHRRADAFRMNERGWTGQIKNIRAHVEQEQTHVEHSATSA